MKKTLFIILLAFTLGFSAQAATVRVDNTKAEYTNKVADEQLDNVSDYDTSVFEGNPAYLMQDTLAGGRYDPSGWDLDKRGGFISSSENTFFRLEDVSDVYAVTMEKHFMPHKEGKVTFESAFSMAEMAESGFSYTLLGDGKSLLTFSTAKSAVYAQSEKIGTLVPDKLVHLKAEINMDAGTAVIYFDGKEITTVPLDNAPQLDGVIISTSKENEMSVNIRYVYFYINYLVNECFMSADVGTTPSDWELFSESKNPGVAEDNNQVYPDLFSYALNDISTLDGVKLIKHFEPQTEKLVFETRFIIPQKTDGVGISVIDGENKVLELVTSKGNICLADGTIVLESYLANLWHFLKIKADLQNGTADIYLNYKKVAENVKLRGSRADGIMFETGVKKVGTVRIDDVVVYKDVPLPEDYVPTPEPVEPEGNLHVGMQMYSMWNEGNHFGWDRITSYPDRMPYLGPYSETSKEYADWVIKYQTEHGIDYQINIFSRAIANKNEPVKLPTRYHYFYNGYLQSEYSNYQKFAILYTTISQSTLGGFDDFCDNVAPYIVEYFFKDPRYLVKDNKPVMYMYGASNFVTVIGDLDKANEAIDYLDKLCIEAGFDGVTVVPDGTSGNFSQQASKFAQKYVYSYGWQTDARDAETQILRNELYFANGLNVVGSVTMGWGRGPWVENDPGEIFAPSEEIGKTVTYLKDRYKEMENSGEKPTNLITLTCWDEYGEGHFFNPTRVAGFETLNAIRNAATAYGEKTFEELPTSRALARMDVLYEPGRRVLKTLKVGEPYVAPGGNIDYDRLEVLAEWDFENANDTLGWTVDKQVENLRIENGALVGDITDADPGIRFDGTNIPARKVKAVRVTTYTEGGGVGEVYYQTDVDPDMGVQGKRFDIIQAGRDYKTYTGVPYTAEKLKGNITAVRWDPANGGYPYYTHFGVKKIQILGYDEPEEEEVVIPEKPITVKYNGAAMETVVSPILKDGKTYISCYRMLNDIGCKTKWNYPTRTLYVEKDNVSFTITEGSTIAKVNGEEKDIGYAPYYDDGNFMVPIREVLEILGAKVTWNGEDRVVETTLIDPNDTYDYLYERDESKPLSYMFETRADLEGWYGNAQISSLTLKNGILTMRSIGNDPILMSGKFEAEASNYHYARIRMLNKSASSNMMFFFITQDSGSWGGGKRYDVKVSSRDEGFKEYIIKLDDNSLWKGTVTQFRFDPIDASGTVLIDSIEILESID